ncbi:MAG TPA: C1 family peptidase [Bacteroidales bacterium]|nr:C1 family peptidase [Bacteroidales bacterium]
MLVFRKNLTGLFLMLGLAAHGPAQDVPRRDKAVFKERTPGYYENVILKEIDKNSVRPEPRKTFRVDYGQMKFPNDTALYAKYWHTPALSQGNTGTCWAFGSVAMLESEVYRIHKIKTDLSEMYVVYYDYLERAKDFVKTRGATYFEEGSESNALVRMLEMYGIVPYTAYSGLLPGQKVYDHSDMIEEMKVYLAEVKKNNAWNENEVVKNIKTILNAYMGEPPSTFVYEGVTYTPQTFVSDFLNINPRDYFSFMSTLSAKFNQKAELVEPDNWWHSKDYYNVCLEDFFLVLTEALKNGYTVCLCGDVSEPGIDYNSQTFMIPTFDIPSAYIDDAARQLRLNNESTTDDHCMEVVGYCVYEDKYWFLLKDSGAGAFGVPQTGYRFMSEDYVKLKMMNLLLYKYAAKKVLDKIIK